MISKKILFPIAALAMAAFFGCESSTTSATNAVSLNNAAGQDSTVVKDGTFNNVVPGGDTTTNQGTSLAGGLVSCDVTTIGNGHTCIEAEAVFADSVRMMCDTSEAYIIAASYREEGCPAGASKKCFEKNGNDSANVYFYGAVFATMSCKELLDEGEDVEIINPSTAEPMEPLVLTGDKIGCSYYGIFCAEGDAAYAERCVAEGGSVVNACPAGGEKCNLGQMEENASFYLYPNSGLSCEMILDYIASGF